MSHSHIADHAARHAHYISTITAIAQQNHGTPHAHNVAILGAVNQNVKAILANPDLSDTDKVKALAEDVIANETKGADGKTGIDRLAQTLAPR